MTGCFRYAGARGPYDSGMNPTVTGALVAGAAALIGFGAAALTNSATLRANRRLADEIINPVRERLPA